MSSLSTVTQRSAASEGTSAAAPVTDVPRAVHADAPENDDTATSAPATFKDPLLGMAIATGILFAALAMLLASF